MIRTHSLMDEVKRGRPPIPEEKVQMIRSLAGRSLREIARLSGVDWHTVKKYLR